MSDEETVVADPVPDASVPYSDPVPDAEPTPDAPIVDATPDAPTHVEEPARAEPIVIPPPAPPMRWFLVEYRALAGAVLPLEAAGKWWHANTQHVLAAPCFDKVKNLPGFEMLHDVQEPVGASPCVECGG